MQRLLGMRKIGGAATLLGLLGYAVLAQPQWAQGPPRFGPPGPGGPGEREEVELVDRFDSNEDGWLNQSERALARQEPKLRANTSRRGRRGPGRRGPSGRGPGGRGPQSNDQPTKPGKKIAPAEVASYPDSELYDPAILRTLFFEFENEDWETELSDFRDTDVEVPALLTVDGQKYPNVGVRFRGQSSYFMVPAGRKRSLNVSIDMADSDQRLAGYKTLNLLNCNGDSSLMSTVLYSEIAAKHIPVPKANFVRVVINGESWGVYANVQQFNKDFLGQHFDTKKGTRWKVPGSPRGDGGLRYLGENVEPYQQRFSIKPSDNQNAWQDLIRLCRTLNETPSSQLVSALEPLLDIDSTLWFLALDVALVNSDGYWVRASDYSLYQDPEGRFHTIPHDMNEALVAGVSHGRPGGRGVRGGRNRGNRRAPPPGFGPPGLGRPGPVARGPRPSVTLDPLVGIDDNKTPLRSRLLAVPELRERYLSYVREIAKHSFDWAEMGPRVAAYRELIADEVKADTRKLSTYEQFLTVTDPRETSVGESAAEPPKSLREFFERRRDFLLDQIAY